MKNQKGQNILKDKEGRFTLASDIDQVTKVDEGFSAVKLSNGKIRVIPITINQMMKFLKSKGKLTVG